MCRGIPRHPRRTCMLPHSKLRLGKDQTDPCGIPRHLWRLLCHRPSPKPKVSGFKTKLVFSGDGIGFYQGVYQKLPWEPGSNGWVRFKHPQAWGPKPGEKTRCLATTASPLSKRTWQWEAWGGFLRGQDKDSIRKVDSVPNHQKPSILERYTIYIYLLYINLLT